MPTPRFTPPEASRVSQSSRPAEKGPCLRLCRFTSSAGPWMSLFHSISGAFAPSASLPLYRPSELRHAYRWSLDHNRADRRQRCPQVGRPVPRIARRCCRLAPRNHNGEPCRGVADGQLGRLADRARLVFQAKIPAGNHAADAAIRVVAWLNWERGSDCPGRKVQLERLEVVTRCAMSRD